METGVCLLESIAGAGRSLLCIAWCTRVIGGTTYTLSYAQKQGLRVWKVAQSGEWG